MDHQKLTRLMKAIDECGLGPDVRVWIETVESSTAVTKTDSSRGKREIPVVKTDEERYVLGIVLEPLKEMGQKDSQNDTYSAEEVRTACYKFMEDYRNIGLQHEQYINDGVRILENWIAPQDLTICGQQVTKGTWLMGIRVLSDQVWEDIKAGKITGLSIGGLAVREQVA